MKYFDPLIIRGQKYEILRQIVKGKFAGKSIGRLQGIRVLRNQTNVSDVTLNSFQKLCPEW